MALLTTVQAEAAKIAIKDMMKKGRVDICAIRDILSMTGGVPDENDMAALRLLHCVPFTDYTQTMKMELPGLLKRVLESPSMEVNVTFRAQARLPESIVSELSLSLKN